MVSFLVVAALGIGSTVVISRLEDGRGLSPLRSRIVATAQGQVGYRTDPAHSYCNKFSEYWGAGADDCGNGARDEEWCADFAAWVWQQAGAEVVYRLAPGFLNSDSASFYVWGTEHGTWHAVGSGYTPQPGDVAVYGLDTTAVTAVHVAVVTGSTGDGAAPDVVNGDGDRTGYSVVEVGSQQAYADAATKGAALSGYVSPSPPAPPPGSP